MIYCLALREDSDLVERRERLDDALSSQGVPQRETWGRTPAQQRAMKKARDLGGGTGPARVAGRRGR